MPDTQAWTWNQGGTTLATWRAVAQALCRQRDRFAMVLHTGDLVDHPHERRQWDNAVSVLQELDACAMPLAIAIGNHDYDQHPGAEGTPAPSARRWSEALGRLAPRTDRKPAPSGRTALHPLAPGWFVLTVDYFPSQADLDWIAAAIDARRTSRFVLLHHYCVDPGGIAPFRTCRQLLERHPEIRIAVSGHTLGNVRDSWQQVPRKNGEGLAALYQNYQHVPELAAWGVVVELEPGSGDLCVWSEDVLSGEVRHPAVAASPAGPVNEGSARRCLEGAAAGAR